MRARLVGRTKSSVVRARVGVALCAMMMLVTAALSIYAVSGAQATDTTQPTQNSVATAPATVTRYQETNANLLYSGSWRTSYFKANSGGSQKFTWRSGTSIAITFDGTGLTWIATTGPSCGIARVVLDRGTAVLVDLYASKRLYQQKVYGTGVLANGPHMLEIQWTGQKNLSSQNTYVYVDALDVMGSLTKASPTAVSSVSQTTTTAATASAATMTTLDPTTTTMVVPPTTTTAASATTTTLAPTTTTIVVPTTATTVAPATTTTLAPTTTTTAPTQSTGKTYYVDAADGNDSNNGTSTATPWKNLTKVQSTTFSAGDTVLLKRGGTFQNQRLIFGTATGTAGSPVTVGAYGSGAKPVITGSLKKSTTGDWTSQGGNIWRTTSCPKDVGNIVFNGGTFLGQKHFAGGVTLPGSAATPQVPLTAQGDFYYDATGDYVDLYSTSNPASYYSSIELCQDGMHNSVYDNSYITVQDLDFRYNSSMGAMFVMGGSIPTRGVGQILERCDFSFEGGSIGTGSATPARDGYGVMLWMNGTDITVRDCTFDEIWQKPFSIQCNNSAGTSRFNGIYMYRNVLKRAKGAFELWLYGHDNNRAANLYFVNNTVYEMGNGLMETERHNSGYGASDSVGMNYSHYGTTTNAVCKNNIFYGDSSFFHKLQTWNAPTYWDLKGWDIDHNCYYPDSSAAFKDNGTVQTLAQWRGNPWAPDAHSIASDPLFMNAAGGDFRLRAGSRCLGAGVNIPGITSSQTPNIGAY
jgi:hypothetical protein